MLSRGVAGIRGPTLIVNFPGSPRSIEQTGAAIADALPHALALIAGGPAGHRRVGECPGACAPAVRPGRAPRPRARPAPAAPIGRVSLRR